MKKKYRIHNGDIVRRSERKHNMMILALHLWHLTKRPKPISISQPNGPHPYEDYSDFMLLDSRIPNFHRFIFYLFYLVANDKNYGCLLMCIHD